MLGIIVATLFISLVANIFLKKFGLPTIIGYIFTGTIISYVFGLHDAVNNHELKEIAEFGIVFLMFTIGLEFSVQHLKDMKYEVFVVGSLQILITIFVVLFISYYIFNIEKYTALVISMAVAMSSTAIILKTFNETGEINKKYGKNALGILIMQDIAVIPILIIIGVISSQESSLRSVIAEVAIGVLILLIALYVIGKYLLEPFFNQIVKTKSDELFIGSILFLAIGASYGAHVLGFSYSLGAFVAGMLIAETKYKHQAEADLIPFRDILLGIFFITVGMQINFDVIFEYIHYVALLLVSIMFIKFIIIYFLIRMSKANNKRTTLKTAFSLIQIGEFALAILELARVNSIIEAPYGQVMIVTIVISMVLTPFILKNLSRISDHFIKDEFADLEVSLKSCPYKEHLVVLGYGEFGQSVVAKLKDDGEVYIIVENNIDQFHLAQKNNEPVIFGSASNREILKNSYMKRAKKVIVAIDNPKKLHLVCENIMTMISGDKIIVKVHSKKERNSLFEMGLENIIVENETTVKELQTYI
ncbi:cation:proton antiporter [bacterium]|jgi:CPA2 family monovalent cation:H+ antiporter-2|nr:cation:proton antiporter [bacterium]MBU1435573.1 cation:proton antiporter [bacterium]MBU1502503.1 cation:proton antiporter [bacterium]